MRIMVVMDKKLGYKVLRYGLLTIMVLMPFNALLSTWVGSNLGGLLWWRAWKEILLAGITLIGLYYFLTDRKLRSTIWARTINKVILLYGFWHVFIVLVSVKDADAVSQGLAINLRFLVAFVLMQIVVFYHPISRSMLGKLILIPSIGVIAFGLLQVFALPKEFLSWFGYNKKTTIPPYFMIDQQPDNLRYASTISGPNTLGAYLVLPVMLVVGSWKSVANKTKKFSTQLFTICYILAAIIVLYSSHSRSAWVAAVISLGFYVVLRLPSKLRFAFIAVSIIGLVLAGGIGYTYRDSQFVQDVVLHDDPAEGGEVSSNVGHAQAIENGLVDVKAHPLFGCGVGCAGPASVRHSGGAKIAENYYIQVAQETGLIGLSIFVAIVLLLVKELYKKRQDNMALVMLSTFVGLSIANLLLHTWADDTLAYIWWLTAAIVLYSAQKYENLKSS